MKTNYVALFFMMLLSSTVGFAQEEPKKEFDKAFSLTSTIWETSKINVCWENPSSGNTTERGWVRDAVRDTWEKESRLTFTGWGTCQSSSMGIRIKIADEGPHVKRLGSSLNGMRDGMVLNFTFNNWSTSCRSDREFCIKAIAVHEFGHAISFAHEQNRRDAPAECMAEEQGTDGDWTTSPYDLNSVMNYCNPNWNGDGRLSPFDIVGVRTLYGAPRNTVKEFGKTFAVGDFNRDGYDDVAVGSPGNDTGQGRVYIYKGGRTGTLTFWQTLDQTFLGLNESGDRFGTALAAGDFNGDGYDDLAVGLPNESPGSGPRSGYVMLFRGTRTKLAPWHGLDQKGIGRNEAGDLFGASLTAGDFNGDGIDDLAVGLPGEAPASNPRSGFVMTFKGTRTKVVPWQGIGQDGIGANEAGDQFGAALASGDFNGDGIDDLAVGLPGEAPASDPKSGFVMTFKGTRGNMTPWQGIDQKGIGANEAGDRFGATLAAGDFNGDGIDDLAVGLPGEAPGGDPRSGFVMTFKGTRSNMTPWQGIDQKGIGANEAGDQFGASLTVGDFNGDGMDDLAVGLPGEAPASDPKSGYVMTFKGSRNKMTPWQGIDQDRLGDNELGDQFGTAIICGDFNNDNKMDLVVGGPNERPGTSPHRTGSIFNFNSVSGLLKAKQGIDP